MILDMPGSSCGGTSSATGAVFGVMFVVILDEIGRSRFDRMPDGSSAGFGWTVGRSRGLSGAAILGGVGTGSAGVCGIAV